MAAVTACIADQIAKATPQRVRSNRHYAFGRDGERQRRSLTPNRCGYVLEQQRDVGFDRGFGPLTARKVEIAVNHPLHFGDIRFEFPGRRIIAQQLESELHSGQRRA